MKTGINLIGMPGAGKSTVGVLLAKAMGLEFVDTDLEIQIRTGKSLQAFLDSTNYLELRRIEEQVLLDTDAINKVIATGGSAVYSTAGMNQLKQNSLSIYLQASLPLIESRIHNFETRGVARQKHQTLQQLYQQRCALYEFYADITLTCDGKTAEELVDMIIRQVRGT